MKPICFKTRGGGNYSGTKGAPIRSGKGGTGLLFYEDKTFTVATGTDQYIATFLCVTSPFVQEWKQPALLGTHSAGLQSDSPRLNLFHVPSLNTDSPTSLTMEASPNTNHGPLNPVQSTFWSEELLASPSPLPASAKESPTLGATLPLHFLDWLTSSSPSGSSGKTSLVSCLREEGGTLVPFSGRWSNSGMGSPTESWTLNTSEYPSVVVESSLSLVLETGELPQRFFLSAKACTGILRRSAKRGKALPPMLKAALEQVCQYGGQETKQTPNT